MPFTDYLEDRLLDLQFGNVAYSPTTTLYVGLSSTAINDDGTGVTEPTTGGYARVAVPNDTTNWTDLAGGGKQNGTVIEFPQATADYGNPITHFFIADTATTGGIIAYNALGTAKTITTGDTASFGIGSLTITLE